MGLRAYALLAALLSIALWIGTVGAVRRVAEPLRLDVSSGRGASLSPASRAVLAELTEPLRITYFHTTAGMEQRPELRAFAERVTAALRSYRAAAPHRIILEERQPVRLSAAEDEAIRAGLQPLPESWSAEPIYLGVVARNMLDESAVIPMLSPLDEPRLEQAITSMIARLEDPSRPPPQAPLHGSSSVEDEAAAQIEQRASALRRELVVAEGAWFAAEGAAQADLARAKVLALRQALRAAEQERAAGAVRIPPWLAWLNILAAPVALLLAAAALQSRGLLRLRRERAS